MMGEDHIVPSESGVRLSANSPLLYPGRDLPREAGKCSPSVGGTLSFYRGTTTPVCHSEPHDAAQVSQAHNSSRLEVAAHGGSHPPSRIANKMLANYLGEST